MFTLVTYYLEAQENTELWEEISKIEIRKMT